MFLNAETHRISVDLNAEHALAEHIESSLHVLKVGRQELTWTAKKV